LYLSKETEENIGPDIGCPDRFLVVLLSPSMKVLG